MKKTWRHSLLLAASFALVLNSPALSDQVNFQGLAPTTNSAPSMKELMKQVESDPSVANYKARAEAYRRMGKHKEAMDDVNKALDQEPENAVVQLLKGQVFFDDGMFPEAVQEADLALKLDPQAFGGLALRARSYLRLKEYAKALDDANTMLKAKPNSAVAYALRGAAYGGQKKYAEAVSECTTAIKLDPNLAKAYYYRADANQELGQFQSSIDDYTQAIKLQPDYRPAWLGRAWSNYKLGKDKEALSDCSTAITFNTSADLKALNKYVGEKSTNPDIIPDSEFNLGSMLEDDLKNALTLYTDVLKDKPGDPDALRNRGLVYMHLVKYKDAIRDFEQANKGLPQTPDDYSGLGSKEQYEAAKPDYQQGNKDLANGDYESAVKHYQAALQKYPTYGRCWHNLAISLGALGDFFDAELCCIHAVSYRPYDWKLWNTLGYNLYHEFNHDKGDPQKLTAASEALRQSLELQPSTESDKEGVRKLLASVKSYQRALAPVSDFVVTTMPIN